MSLNFTHKPNYFLFAQLFIRHLENHIEKNPIATEAKFNLRNIYDLFQHDFASASTNLNGILNIADEYKVETLNGDQKIIQSYEIDAKEETLFLKLNVDAVASLAQGKQIIAPDATIQE